MPGATCDVSERVSRFSSEKYACAVRDDEAEIASARVIDARVIDLVEMPWLSVNQTRLSRLTAVPMPLLALDVQRAGSPGQPGRTAAAVRLGSRRRCRVAWRLGLLESSPIRADRNVKVTWRCA